jgi:hypothetical protein
MRFRITALVDRQEHSGRPNRHWGAQRALDDSPAPDYTSAT